jgi:hypothetical protein
MCAGWGKMTFLGEEEDSREFQDRLGMKTEYEHHLGVNPPFARALRTWGEAGTVTIQSRTFQPKDKARGVSCLLIGYSPEHPAGTYRMFDPST